MIYKQTIKVFHNECSNKRLPLIMEVLQLMKYYISTLLISLTLHLV